MVAVRRDGKSRLHIDADEVQESHLPMASAKSFARFRVAGLEFSVPM